MINYLSFNEFIENVPHGDWGNATREPEELIQADEMWLGQAHRLLAVTPDQETVRQRASPTVTGCH